MNDVLEGAVNEIADVSPTDSTIEIEEADDSQGGDLVTPSSMAPESETWDADNADEPSTEIENEREPLIPRERFDEVNDEKQRLAAENEALRQHYALAQKASAAGYADPAAYRRDTQWAIDNNYGSLEEYQELSAYNGALTNRFGNGAANAELRQRLLADQQERIRLRNENAQVKSLLRTVASQNLDQAIAAGKAEFAGVEPAHWANIERLCREVGNVAGVKRVLETFAPTLRKTVRTASERAVIESRERRAANNAVPSAEGRGGNPPPLASRQRQSPKQIQNTLLSTLLGYRE